MSVHTGTHTLPHIPTYLHTSTHSCIHRDTHSCTHGTHPYTQAHSCTHTVHTHAHFCTQRTPAHCTHGTFPGCSQGPPGLARSAHHAGHSRCGPSDRGPSVREGAADGAIALTNFDPHALEDAQALFFHRHAAPAAAGPAPAPRAPARSSVHSTPPAPPTRTPIGGGLQRGRERRPRPGPRSPLVEFPRGRWLRPRPPPGPDSPLATGRGGAASGAGSQGPGVATRAPPSGREGGVARGRDRL